MCRFRQGFWLLAVSCLLAGPMATARADGILISGSMSTSATGSYTITSSGTNVPYSDPKSGDPVAGNPLNLSSSGSLQYTNSTTLNLQSSATGTSQASPGSSLFTSLDVSLNASTSDLNRTALSGATSTVAASSQYTASFTLLDTEQFSLSLTANSNVHQTIPQGPVNDPGFGSASLTDSDTSQVIGSVSSSSDLTSSDGLQTFTLTGILGPGTYSVDLSATASSSIDSGTVSITSSGAATFDLTLSPVPEPASALMLALGTTGLAGWLMRRRRFATVA